MSFGLKEIAIIAILAILLFGRGRISALMGDLAKGIKSFKKGMKDPTLEQPEATESEDSNKQDHKTDPNK